MTPAQSAATTNATVKTTISIANSTFLAVDRAAVCASDVFDDALDRVRWHGPRRALEHPHRVGIAGVAADADAARREVDVLGVVLALHARREQVGDVHLGTAPPGRELLDFAVGLLGRRQLLGQLADDVAQTMDLLLASDVAVGAARVLDVLLARHHFPDRLRL